MQFAAMRLWIVRDGKVRTMVLVFQIFVTVTLAAALGGETIGKLVLGGIIAGIAAYAIYMTFARPFHLRQVARGEINDARASSPYEGGAFVDPSRLGQIFDDRV